MANTATKDTDNPNQTGSDALARLNAARFGSLVKPDGRALDGENLPYLRTLRAELHRFSDAVLIELNRIERIAEVEPDEARESFARIRRTRACYRCGASPEHCDCPDEYEPDGAR